MTKIQKTKMSDGRLVLSAWEPTTTTGRHSTITFIDGACFGRIGTDPDPARYDHLPAGSQERIDACDAAYAARYAEAYNQITLAEPWLFDPTTRFTFDRGEITVLEAK